MITSNIDSTKLLNALKEFPINIQNNVMEGAVRAAAKPIVEEARRLVPKDSRNLEKSIGTTKRKGTKGTEVVFAVSARRGNPHDGFYAHMVEFGTSKMSAKPFMRPALEKQERQSIEASKEYIAKRIDKEVLKSR